MINWGHPEKKGPHRGWLSIKVTIQLKTSKNSWEHWKTSKIIWYHPENNWGPIIDSLVQLEEDFNSRKKSSENSRKTSENSWEHRKTPKIIWYHPKNNWGPIIDNLVQFEEDFNSRTEKLRWSGGVRWGYLRPVQFLDHLTVIKRQKDKDSSGQKKINPHSIWTLCFCKHNLIPFFQFCIDMRYLSEPHFLQAKYYLKDPTSCCCNFYLNQSYEKLARAPLTWQISWNGDVTEYLTSWANLG